MRLCGKLAVALTTFVSCGEGAHQWPLLTGLDDYQAKFGQSLAVNCQSACQTLSWRYGSQVSLFDEKEYNSRLSLFWSLQQSQTFPDCIFRPKSSQEVASVVLLSRKTNCPFAVKSGGHAAFAGASNVASGITVDLAELNEITISKDRKIVSIGPGNKWVQVYRQLRDTNLTVVGGRIGHVGVGGLTLGGGISFFSNLYGWACDNVASYQVVTASGDVITASSQSNKDLYWALRGGGNNFGLVTKFEVFSYPQDQGLMWVGKIRHAGAQNASLIQAFVDFGAKGTDLKATMLFSVLYFQKQDQFLCVSELDYAEPVPKDTHPRIFDSFYNIADPLQVTKQTKAIIEVIEEHSASNPNGLRQSYWTATFHLDQGLAHDLVKFWKQEVDPIKNSIAGFVPVITFQVLTMPMMQHMSNEGGNALGLENEEAPLMFIVLSAMWVDVADDKVIFAAYSNWLAKSTARAKESGFDHRYLYMNYASQFQDPIQGYGDKNVAKLKKVAKEYDPNEVFQRLQPGYFKL